MSASIALLAVGPSGGLTAQSQREANPERPTIATHAYTVAPGYAELEQGIRTFGVSEIGEATAWELNLKIGLLRDVQLGVFAPALVRTKERTGVGDIALALKLSRAVSPRARVALVPGVSFPTGDEQRGFGAGRVLSSAIGVLSADVSALWHFDLNAGPMGIGAGKAQWFTSVGLSSDAAIGVATELFDFTAGGAGPPQRGVLAAVLMTLTEWAVLDAGGVIGLTPETPDQLFIGVTTNFGRMFK